MKVGRNDPCLCGSGMKFKKCCGAPAPVPVVLSIPFQNPEQLWEQWTRLFHAYNAMLDDPRVQDALFAYAAKHDVSAAAWPIEEGFDTCVFQAWLSDPREAEAFWSLWSGDGAVARRMLEGEFALWRIEGARYELNGLQTATLVRQRFAGDAPRPVVFPPDYDLDTSTHLVGSVVKMPFGDFVMMPLTFASAAVFDTAIERAVERKVWGDDAIYRVDILRAVSNRGFPTDAEVGYQFATLSEEEE